MYPLTNAYKAQLTNLPYAAGATEIEVNHVTDLPDPATDGDFNLVIWNRAHGDPADAKLQGEFEIVKVTGVAGTTFTVERAQEGTTALELGAGGNWQCVLAATAILFEGINNLIGAKVSTSDIINNLTSEDENKPLSALQGKVLQDGKEPADDKILKEGDVEDSLNSTSVTKPLSAKQGKQLNDDKASLLSESITFQVGSGGDFVTLNEAIEKVSRDYPIYKSQGVRVTLNMVAGFVMEEQVLVDGIDLSWITITGSDSETIIDRSSLTISFAGRFPAFGVIGVGSSPIIDQLFNMNLSGSATTRDFIRAIDNSKVFVKEGGGCKNAGGNGIDANAGCSIVAVGANLSGTSGRAINANAGCSIVAFGANLSDAGGRVINAGSGTQVFARNAITTGGDITLFQGSLIDANGISGSPVFSQAVNTVTSNGIIFN